MSAWFDRYGLAEVYPDLLVGAYPLDAQDVERLDRLSVRRVLNLVEDTEYPPGAREKVAAAYDELGIAEARLKLVDFGRLPADRLEEAVSMVVAWMGQDARVYVHCRAGWQRSASVAAGAVAIVENLDIRAALRLIRVRKPTAEPLPHQQLDLIDWFMSRA